MASPPPFFSIVVLAVVVTVLVLEGVRVVPKALVAMEVLLAAIHLAKQRVVITRRIIVLSVVLVERGLLMIDCLRRTLARSIAMHGMNGVLEILLLSGLLGPLRRRFGSAAPRCIHGGGPAAASGSFTGGSGARTGSGATGLGGT